MKPTRCPKGASGNQRMPKGTERIPTGNQESDKRKANGWEKGVPGVYRFWCVFCSVLLEKPKRAKINKAMLVWPALFCWPTQRVSTHLVHPMGWSPTRTYTGGFLTNTILYYTILYYKIPYCAYGINTICSFAHTNTYLELSGTIWNYLALPGATWSYLELSGATWNYLELSGHTWSFLTLPRAIWRYPELSR